MKERFNSSGGHYHLIGTSTLGVMVVGRTVLLAPRNLLVEKGRFPSENFPSCTLDFPPLPFFFTHAWAVREQL